MQRDAVLLLFFFAPASYTAAVENFACINKSQRQIKSCAKKNAMESSNAEINRQISLN